MVSAFLFQEKKAAELAPSSNSIRWNFGPSGTVVSFAEDVGLPSFFNSGPSRSVLFVTLICVLVKYHVNVCQLLICCQRQRLSFFGFFSLSPFLSMLSILLRYDLTTGGLSQGLVYVKQKLQGSLSQYKCFYFAVDLASSKYWLDILPLTASVDRYPPAREKCAAPACSNSYKYRDSKSNVPLCSLQCYRVVHHPLPVTATYQIYHHSSGGNTSGSLIWNLAILHPVVLTVVNKLLETQDAVHHTVTRFAW